jgi:hypothetical protein
MGAERFEHLGPEDIAAVGTGLRLPEGGESELSPEVGDRPAVAEAAGLANPQGGEAHFDDVTGGGRGALVVGEEAALEEMVGDMECRRSWRHGAEALRSRSEGWAESCIRLPGGWQQPGRLQACLMLTPMPAPRRLPTTVTHMRSLAPA